jgi:DnaJ family protein C protein 7
VEALWIQTRICYHLTSDVSEVEQNIISVLTLDGNHIGANELQKKMDNLQKLRQRGNDAFKDKNYKESIEIYTVALNEEDKKLPIPFTAVIYANRAAAYKNLNNFDDAIRDLTSAIERNDAYVKAYVRRAQCYSELELWDEVIKDYSSAISHEPFNTEYVSLLESAQKKLQEQKNRSYYDVIGVPAFSSPADIKKAHRLLALKYHPDKVSSSGISPFKAEKVFKEIQFCYEVLSDPQKKAQYDRELQMTNITRSHNNHTQPQTHSRQPPPPPTRSTKW